MNRPISLRLSFFLWLGLLCVLVIANRSLFTVPMYEEGDAAANALQIINAKSFREILGNYSRWRFHHPGPFFFYMYAFGEILFHDLVPVFPAPNNAHTFMGIALQTGFFIVALHIAANYCRSPLFLPLALICALIHFDLVDRSLPGSVFVSLWPPHVLLFPFLCFLVSCASLAIGRVQHLPIAVFCGSALVHGHVAQPLFVLSLGLGSYLVFWRNAGKLARRSLLVPHLLAGGIVALFSLPIVLDFLRGPDSNFADILAHLYRHHSPKTWFQGFLYVVSFFSYFGTQQILILPDAVSILAERWPYFAIWTVILAYIAFSLYFRPEEPTIDRRFERSLSIVLVAALSLSVIWARKQDGQMFNFNGYYIFSIPYGFLLLFSARFAARLTVPGIPRIRPALIAGAIVAFSIFNWSPVPHSALIVEGVERSLHSDPSGTTPKLLSFEDNNWPQAIAAALALQRKEVPFYPTFSRYIKVNIFRKKTATTFS